jgi:hypothetical protein
MFEMDVRRLGTVVFHEVLASLRRAQNGLHYGKKKFSNFLLASPIRAAEKTRKQTFNAMDAQTSGKRVSRLVVGMGIRGGLPGKSALYGMRNAR